MLENYQKLIGLSEDMFRPVQMSLAKKSRNFIAIPIYISFILVNIYLVIYGLLFDNLNFDQTVSFCLSIFGYTQASTAFFSLLLKRHKIKELLLEIDQFWNFVDENYDEHFQRDCLGILNFWCTFIKAYKRLVIVIVFLSMLVAFVFDSYTLSSHVPPSVPRPIFIVYNGAAIYVLSSYVMGFDFMFCGICTLLRLQLKILNYNIALINYETYDQTYYRRRIEAVVEFHNFLLRFVKNLNEVFSTTIFLFLGGIFSCICVIVYGLSESNQLGVQMRYAACYTALIWQLSGFYCLPAKSINDQMNELSYTIYNSDWYKCPHLSVKKDLVLITLKAQQNTIIYAGNLIPLDVTTFTKIFKTTITFYAALKNIKGRND